MSYSMCPTAIAERIAPRHVDTPAGDGSSAPVPKIPEAAVSCRALLPLLLLLLAVLPVLKDNTDEQIDPLN